MHNVMIGVHTKCLVQDNALPAALANSLQAAQHTVNKEMRSFWLSKEALRKGVAKTATENACFYMYRHLLSEDVKKHVLGCEWWVHVRPSDEYMPTHFDKDEGVWIREHRLVHPLLSSVYYLNEIGGKTLVIDQKCTENMEHLIPVQPLGGYLCPPKSNRLLVFDGHLLHTIVPSAPDYKRVRRHKTQTSSAAATSSIIIEDDDEYTIDFVKLPPKDRTTFMVNWWGVDQLQDETCVSLDAALAEQTIEEVQSQYGKPIENIMHFVDGCTDIHSDIYSDASIKAHLTSITQPPPELVGPDVTSMYFFDHDGSKQRVYDSIQKNKS